MAPNCAAGWVDQPVKKIAVVSSSRADFAHLYWPLLAMQAERNLDVQILVTGAHLSPEFGDTSDLVRELDLPCTEIESLISSDTDVGMAKTIGVTTLGFADVLGKSRPDLMLIIADRYEMLAPASVALALRIPIAHIEGGEISEGAIDDAVRNALTKMSHLHFTPTEQARQRVLAMGEEPWRVHTTGAPSIDFLRNADLFSKSNLEKRLAHGLDSPLLVVAYHPLTIAEDTLVETDAFFAALEAISGRIVFCFPNADAGSRAIIQRARQFCAARDTANLHVNLPPLYYWSLLNCADALIGNSSSGIMESPSLALPCVNIGDRQRGRLRSANIIDVPPDAPAIVAAITQALDARFRETISDMKNPYGDGQAGVKIASLLASAPERSKLLAKRALPVRPPTCDLELPCFEMPDAD